MYVRTYIQCTIHTASEADKKRKKGRKKKEMGILFFKEDESVHTE